MVMSKRTLYEALGPLRIILNLYGANWRAEKNIFWKTLKFPIAVFFTCYYVSETGGYILQRMLTLTHPVFTNKRLNLYFIFEIMSWLVNTLTYVSCLLQWRRWGELVELSKGCWMTDQQCRRIKRCLQLFLYAPSLIYSLHLSIYCGKISGYSLDIMLKNYHYFVQIILHIIPYLFLALVASYICGMAYYVKIAWNELIEESETSKSDLRRRKMTTRSFTAYYRLTRLIRRVDDVGSFIMFTLRATTALSFSLVIYQYKLLFEANGDLLLTLRSAGEVNLNVLNAFLLIFYLRMASATNKLVPSIGRVISNSAVLEKTSMGFISFNRYQLELQHLIELNHLVLDHSQLTLSGDPISEETLFNLCTEAVDNTNCVNSII